MLTIKQYEQEKFPLLAHIEDKSSEIADHEKAYEALNERKSKTREEYEELKSQLNKKLIQDLENQLNELQKILSGGESPANPACT